MHILHNVYTIPYYILQNIKYAYLRIIKKKKNEKQSRTGVLMSILLLNRFHLIVQTRKLNLYFNRL